MRTARLSSSELAKLNYERFYYPCPIVQKRLHGVYGKLVLGQSYEQSALLAGQHRNSVSKWVKCYQQEGLEGICKTNYGNNKSVLDEYSEGIIASFKKRPPTSAKEAASRIEDLTGIRRSLSQVRNFMKRHKFRFITMGHIPAKADPKKQRQWVDEKLNPAIEAAERGECHLLFMDAAHFILQPFICAVWCITRLFVKASAGRNRINVLGAVHAITQEVVTLINTTYITADTIVDFLKQLDEQFNDLPIVIVLDNARYQHCNLVKTMAESLGITLLFLPTYSPNLNIIERLWKFTKKKILYAKYYDCPAKFHLAITSFFKIVNQNHANELKSLLTLSFQYFEIQNAQIHPV